MRSGPEKYFLAESRIDFYHSDSGNLNMEEENNVEEEGEEEEEDDVEEEEEEERPSQLLVIIVFICLCLFIFLVIPWITRSKKRKYFSKSFNQL